jgi:chemotaxis protein methyltransferase CheR
MMSSLCHSVEERFGINADPDDVKKLQTYVWDTYGRESPEILEKVISSGEAAGFLTVSETYFFREPVHFSFLGDLLPTFEGSGIQLCSAATSTGCEAYSIAMLIESYNKSAQNPVFYHIDAFDINPKVIETARRGVYSERILREDGSCFRHITDSYLKKTYGGYLVDDSLKKNICFFVHNLMDELPPKTYDLIFFRNAFIYFSPIGRGRVLSNLSAALREGGILFVGVSETAGVQHSDLTGKNQNNDVFYFQKPMYRNGIVL